MSRPPLDRQRRLPGLTGYRFILAFTVLFVHALAISDAPGEDLLTDLTATVAPLAAAAVSSFFVLSGFVLTWSAPEGDTPARFWRRRAAKILPNHVVTWSLTLLLTAAFVFPTASIGPAVANLLLVQTWIPDPSYFYSVNIPAWSISCEMLFYALFPVLLTLSRRIPADRLWYWCAGVAALIVLLPLPTYLAHGQVELPAPMPPLPTSQLWLLYVFPPTRLFEFILGILLARLVQTQRWIGIPTRWAVTAALTAFLALPLLPEAYRTGAALAVPLAVMIPTLAVADLHHNNRWLTRPTMTALGNSSYALYLIHFPIALIVLQILTTGRGPHTATSGILVFTTMIIMSVLAAIALYTWIEAPLMRRLGRKRPPAARTTGAADLTRNQSGPAVKIQNAEGRPAAP